MAPSNTQKHARAPVAITRSAANDIAAVLIKHNPAAPKAEIETTVRAVVATLKSAVKHSHLQREVAQAFVEPASRQASGRTANKRLIDIAAEAPVEESQGEGFGELLPMEEGRKRVAAYATSVRLEDWAGAVAGPGEIERDLGTRRSTLHEWQKRGAVIGLLKGERKHVYPLAQFIDGRPIEGMARVTKIIANPRAAWVWLTRPHPTGDKTPPLERLKQGRIAEVAAAAERDFG